MDRTTSLVTALLLIFILLIAVLVVSPLSETAAFAEPAAYSEVPLQAADASAISYLDDPLVFTPSFTVTLPIVLHGYRYRPPCSPESPFSLEIAAINQIVPDETRDAPERALAEAEWLDRIEEGFPTLVEALADSGACWTRVELKWSQIQPNPPPAPYHFTFFDERLQLLADSGVQIVGLVNGVPDWAGEHELGPIYRSSPEHPDRIPDFTQFLTDLVSRYKQPPYSIRVRLGTTDNIQTDRRR